ncbi:MAG: methyltransferase domain-containing protein [Chitinispirillaceae bacterium]|nr:methyltransferase domain-containing protein [Chitinispirillaceae bacterium]
MHDNNRLFQSIGLKEGFSILDLGCGPGDYSIEAAARIGPSGTVYAMDKEQELLDHVKERSKNENLHNIKTITGSIAEHLPLENESIDVCLAVTVLHIPGVSEKKVHIFSEVMRVLKSGGKLFTIDVKKEDSSFGPPMYMRLSPDDIESAARNAGLHNTVIDDLGYCFLMCFQKGVHP